MVLQSEPQLDLLRVDQVGSLLRPPELKDAFARHLRDELSEDELGRVQDEAIRAVVAKQDARQLPIVTDGEFRRHHFMESFADVTGMEGWKRAWRDLLDRLSRSEERPLERGKVDPGLAFTEPTTSRLRLARNRPREEYTFAQALTKRPVKMTLINVDRIWRTYDHEGSRAVYPQVEELLTDLVTVQRQIVRELCDASCRYIHIDGPEYTSYVDSRALETMRARGEDPVARMMRAIDNGVIDSFAGVTFGLHLCRGNRQSKWHRTGAYDAIAEQFFNGVKHQRLLLEYDTERAGTFEPLKFVPKDKVVVLGLITTKTGRVETVDKLRRRIDEAGRWFPIDRLALSPQCGFASVIAGNLLTEEEQWRKLDVMLETAARVWG